MRKPLHTPQTHLINRTKPNVRNSHRQFIRLSLRLVSIMTTRITINLDLSTFSNLNIQNLAGGIYMPLLQLRVLNRQSPPPSQRRDNSLSRLHLRRQRRAQLLDRPNRRSHILKNEAPTRQAQRRSISMAHAPSNRHLLSFNLRITRVHRHNHNSVQSFINRHSPQRILTLPRGITQILASNLYNNHTDDQQNHTQTLRTNIRMHLIIMTSRRRIIITFRRS